MSYSFGISPDPVAVGDLATALIAARDANSYFTDLAVEARDQSDAGIAAAVEMVKAVIPSPDSLVFASVSGHANPGHSVTEGWANDCLYVSVSLATPPVVPAPVEEAVAVADAPAAPETVTGAVATETDTGDTGTEEPPSGDVPAPVEPTPESPAPAEAIAEPVTPDPAVEIPAATDTVVDTSTLVATGS